jgi:hypothetical protein
MEVIENNIKNIYVIKSKLSNLKAFNGCYEYDVGNFLIKINTNKVQEPPSQNKNDRVTFYEKVDVSLFEKDKAGASGFVYVKVGFDKRFCDYEPIRYEGYNHYDLNGMPIIQLCELIKYLYKLSSLTVFM